MNKTTSNSDGALHRLLLIMERLRDPDHGCAWDRQQDFASIAPHTLEEVYEVIDAIETGDTAQLKDELGDLLFQIVFYAQLGREQQLFDFDAIAAGIGAKLLRRHPHVFPGGSLDDSARSALGADQVAVNWEALKSAERRSKASADVSALDDIPLALSALLRAAKLQKRAAIRGFDWKEISGVHAKLREELAELEQALATHNRAQMEEELGDLLFTVVNLSRHLQLNPETALRSANRKFEQRFRAMEALLRHDEVEMEVLDAAQHDAYWERVKSLGKKAVE